MPGEGKDGRGVCMVVLRAGRVHHIVQPLPRRVRQRVLTPAGGIYRLSRLVSVVGVFNTCGLEGRLHP